MEKSREMKSIRNMTDTDRRLDEQKTKNDVLMLAKRMVPGTADIELCKILEYCTENNVRYCGDIKTLCITCREGEGGYRKILGGMSFLYGIEVKGKKNGIVVHRYGQAEGYATLVEGDGINDILEKFEKDEVIKDITEKTKFIRDEQKEAEDLKKIEAFKMSDANILVTQKNSNGKYSDLDKRLIEIANEKEKETGNKIKIIDKSEISKTAYIFGIDCIDCIDSNSSLMKKLELEAKEIMDVDDRISIYIFPGKLPGKCSEYLGFLAIYSMEDDILGINDEKDRWRKYFTEKYTGISFIETYKGEDGKWT